jgi:hypothetical protein
MPDSMQAYQIVVASTGQLLGAYHTRYEEGDPQIVMQWINWTGSNRSPDKLRAVPYPRD